MQAYEEASEKREKQERAERSKLALSKLTEQIAEWEEKHVVSQLERLRTFWEVPCIGHFLYVVHEAMGLEYFNFSELEYGILQPRSSQYLAQIMCCLLREDDGPPLPKRGEVSKSPILLHTLPVNDRVAMKKMYRRIAELVPPSLNPSPPLVPLVLG